MWTWTMWLHTTNTTLNTTFISFPNIHPHSAMSASPRVALGEWVLVTLDMVGSAKNLKALLRNLVFKCCSSMLGSTIWAASSKQTCIIFLYLSLLLHFSATGYFLWQVFFLLFLCLMWQKRSSSSSAVVNHCFLDVLSIVSRRDWKLYHFAQLSMAVICAMLKHVL